MLVGREDPRDDGRQHIQLWREGDDSKVSRQHCRIDAGPLAVLVTDLGSSKGTRIDGEKVNSALLRPGQELQVGSYKLRYEIGLGDAAAKPAAERRGFLSKLPSLKKTAGVC